MQKGSAHNKKFRLKNPAHLLFEPRVEYKYSFLLFLSITCTLSAGSLQRFGNSLINHSLFISLPILQNRGQGCPCRELLLLGFNPHSPHHTRYTGARHVNRAPGQWFNLRLNKQELMKFNRNNGQE